MHNLGTFSWRHDLDTPLNIHEQRPRWIEWLCPFDFFKRSRTSKLVQNNDNLVVKIWIYGNQIICSFIHSFVFYIYSQYLSVWLIATLDEYWMYVFRYNHHLKYWCVKACIPKLSLDYSVTHRLRIAKHSEASSELLLRIHLTRNKMSPWWK